MISLKKQELKYLFFALVSVIFISIFSKSTSIFLPTKYTLDSAMFQVIGRGITKGLVPYKDLFDHKGPILYFIQALGYSLNIFISSIFLDKIINIFTKNIKKQFFSFLAAFVFLGLFFGEGNLSEEWSLSFILIALYLNLNDLFNNKFSRLNYFITGTMFGLISLIRLNNAASIIGFFIFYFLYLIKTKKYKELLYFIFTFILGILMVYTPVFIFFYNKNALFEMINDTFLFNFNYSGISCFDTIKPFFCLLFSIPIYFLLISIYKSNYNIEIKSFLSIITIINAIAVCIGQNYLHYFVILTPLIAILFTLPHSIKSSIIAVIIIYAIIIYSSTYISFLMYDCEHYKKALIVEEDVEKLKPYIEQNSSILAINIPSSIYIFLDTLPSYKYL